MNALPSGGSGRCALRLVPDAPCSAGVSEFLVPNAGPNKRKRRPAGTPDPDAEVVALSPKTLMESDRYVCEICNQGFQRDQNLQMHRRRHKVPWKLLKRPHLGTTKRVYICPEGACLHHDPAHALGDLVGIKKHYRRKHCTEKQWKCDKCSKGYAVQSDYKAHLKTCGTRGHCCDCGRVFSRVESFIEHQDTCSALKRKTTPSGDGSERLKPSLVPHHATDRSNSNESPSQSSDTTQAVSFAQSGIILSDTAARSTDLNSPMVLDEHARRTQAESQPASPSAAMPAWLTESRRCNELELLQRLPSDHAHDYFSDQGSHGSGTSQVTLYGSNSAYPEVTVTLEPSLQLCIGRSAAEVASSCPYPPYTDVKPSLRVVLVKEALPNLAEYHPKQTVSVEKMSFRPATAGFQCAVAQSTVGQSAGKQRMDGAGTDHAVSLSGHFLAALSPVESSECKNRNVQMGSYYNSAVAGAYHENRAGNLHEPDPAPGTRASTRRGFSTVSRLEPATSSVITSRPPLHLDVAQTDRLFGANSKSVNEALRSQKQNMAAAASAPTDQACEQTRTDLNLAWSDPARERRTTDEVRRRECDKAHRELARAETLRREAREQLRFAAAEKAYADRARAVAKRQIETSAAELVKAKRLREHAQAELEKAAPGCHQFPPPSLCHACKSAIQGSATIPSTSPASASPISWLMRAPSPPTCQQLEADSPGGGRSTEPAIDAKRTDQPMVDANRIKLYNCANRMARLNKNSGELWDAPQNPPLVASPELVSSPGQSQRRGQVAPKDLDLN